MRPSRRALRIIPCFARGEAGSAKPANPEDARPARVIWRLRFHASANLCLPISLDQTGPLSAQKIVIPDQT